MTSLWGLKDGHAALDIRTHLPPARFFRVLLRRLPPRFGEFGVEIHRLSLGELSLLKERARKAAAAGLCGLGLWGLGFAQRALVLFVDCGVSNLGSNTFFGVLKASSCLNRSISFFSSEQS